MNPKEKRKLEREERHRREKEELEQMQSYNPFGKGGGGAPYKDGLGNSIAQRRPFSVVRGNNAITDVRLSAVNPLSQKQVNPLQ
jgi:hypothetical protein